jgi:hypothetical protein
VRERQRLRRERRRRVPSASFSPFVLRFFVPSL